MKTNFITIRCEKDHRLTTDTFKNLQEAIDSINNQRHYFVKQHNQCGKIIAIPTDGIAHINIKCTKCPQMYKFTTSKKPCDIDIQSKIIARSIQHSHRKRLILHHGGCLRANCNCCKLSIKDQIVQDENGKNILLEKFNCKGKSLIYVLVCTHCQKKYVGQCTTNLNLRLNNHLSHIRKLKTHGVSIHFQNHGLENLKIGILESRPNATQSELNIIEAYWIYKLDTINTGLNNRDESKYHIDQHVMNACRHLQHSADCCPYLNYYITETHQSKT